MAIAVSNVPVVRYCKKITRKRWETPFRWSNNFFTDKVCSALLSKAI